MKSKDSQLSNEIVLMNKVSKRTITGDYSQHYFTHIICKSGTASFRIENINYEMGKNDIAIFLPSFVIKNFEYSKDFKATILFISFDLMSKNNPDIGWGIKGFLFTKENPLVHLSEIDAEKCLFNFTSLWEKYKDKGHQFHEQIVNLQLQMFVIDMWNIFSKEIEKRNISNLQGALFERFLKFVEQHCMEEREVDFYSAKLFITSKYLTEVCKKNSGKTASEWIQNYTTQRLIIMLENKRLSCTEIAEALNFSSLSFFSRYVRKVLGVSPGEYRLKSAHKILQ